jgi:hypothetical protein
MSLIEIIACIAMAVLGAAWIIAMWCWWVCLRRIAVLDAALREAVAKATGLEYQNETLRHLATRGTHPSPALVEELQQERLH